MLSMTSSPTEIRERPILFKGDMVRALLSGIKTQTRRVVNMDIFDRALFEPPSVHPGNMSASCPYGRSGDRIWVRESFSDPYPLNVECENFTGFFRATDPDRKVKWKPSIFMPRWVSRITLEITEVRVQRIQDIADDDIRSEGIEEYIRAKGLDPARVGVRAAWIDLWDTINGKRDNGASAWDRNPWTWAITFQRIEPL